MKTRDLYYKTLPALMAAVFLAGACTIFSLKYNRAGVVLPLVFDVDIDANRMLFYLNFYLFFVISAICLYCCLYLTGFFIRGLCFIVGLTSTVISGYILNDLQTISLCMYSAYILVSAVAFTPPRNYFITAFTLVFFTLFLFRPAFLRPIVGGIYFSVPGLENLIIPEFYLITLGVAFTSIRFLTDKFSESDAMVAHLNAVGAKMLLFNHRLQEYIRNLREEAIKIDRLRFTSDLHDSCGYVFTNIIAITEAAMSFSTMDPDKMRDTFLLIRNQAQQGLNRTRETLYMIRKLEDPVSGSIDTVFEMKSIFQEVTGIQVDIESGNMRHDYGPTVNMVITRTVQEAFTNSIRHGQASRILIHFWEFPDSLTMTVSDNGIGARQIVKGIGLAGMEERLGAVGGTLEAFSPEDGGFRLKVVIPLVDITPSIGIKEPEPEPAPQ